MRLWLIVAVLLAPVGVAAEDMAAMRCGALERQVSSAILIERDRVTAARSLYRSMASERDRTFPPEAADARMEIGRAGLSMIAEIERFILVLESAQATLRQCMRR